VPGQEDLAALIAHEVADDRVAAAFSAVPRADFVPREHVHRAYEDVPLPIPHGQVTTQPSLTARMIAALALGRGERPP
jgi:protein-L-isoaspartate(D-aspartate) O-methyltransferase